MEAAEYETMFNVEDAHWWYRGLRALLEQQWRKHVTCDAPRILDIGCGTGANLAMVSERGEATGIDFNAEALARSRARSLTRLACADAAALPFAENTFDVAIMMDILYHKAVPDKSRALREARRVLQPGGTLFVNVPAYDWLRSSHDIAIHTDTRFTRREVADLLAGAKLRVLSITHWNALLLPPIVALRMWRKLRPRTGSDLDDARHGGQNAALDLALAFERSLIRAMPLPLGLSIFAAARRE